MVQGSINWRVWVNSPFIFYITFSLILFDPVGKWNAIKYRGNLPEPFIPSVPTSYRYCLACVIASVAPIHAVVLACRFLF